MLDAAGDEMTAAGWLERLGHPPQGEVVRLRPAAGEHDLGRLSANQRGD